MIGAIEFTHKMFYKLMRIQLLILSFLFFGKILFAQPVNDDCSGLEDLGVAPACPTTIFNNIDATASDIGAGNSPLCFNGGTTQNDVWFSFTTGTDILDFTITVSGTPDGPNSIALTNPQIALYRGDCVFDGLAELGCISAPNGNSVISLDILGLTPETPYFIRINDYSATAAPNWGDFTLCVEEYIPDINMGESESTTACTGTLFDSGGPDGDYSNDEDLTFTICPSDPHACIELDFLEFDIETFFGIFGDQLNVYAGDDTNAPLIASLTGPSNGNQFLVQAESECVTIEFVSDFFNAFAGFEMEWTCTPLACDGSTVDNPTPIDNIPFTGSFSTCEGAATFADSPCGNAPFLTGPEYVLAYDSPGGICAEITVQNAVFGTGVLVLNGPPGDPGTVCVAQSGTGILSSVNFQNPGTYYIVVANSQGCTDFDILIEEAECQLSAALVDALCNPLNGCIELDGLPSIFNFEDGFQDIDVITEINGGCWLGFGAEPDFYWFTIEAQADGPFGFILESAGIPSDIDYNVWGPFTQEEVCDAPGDVIQFIESNQPIRSSWAAGADPTGLADIHPVFGNPVEDEYDCGGFPGAAGDDFTRTIDAVEGEVYVVLINDWGNQIGDEGISVDWSPSEAEVLAPLLPEVLNGDTAICSGESVQILIESGINSITWLEDTTTLSCDFCFDPVATPSETTVYRALIDAVCFTDTIEVRVVVFDVDAGEDVTVCTGEEIQIVAGSNFDEATYGWTAPPGVSLSCTDCPDPIIAAEQGGTYTIGVTLFAPTCTLLDEMTLTVLDAEAPQFSVSEDLQICEGEMVSIGGPPTPGVTYNWSSEPAGFSSMEANPEVDPTITTTYFIAAENEGCPLVSTDSVLVEVFPKPIIDLPSDTFVCQSEPIQLASFTPEPDVTYTWSGPGDIEDINDPNTIAFPQSEGTYVLVAARGECQTIDSFSVTITEIAVDLFQEDTINICRGTSVDLSAIADPGALEINWLPEDGSLNTTIGNEVVATPETITTYFATVTLPGCFKADSVTIVVDSLPSNLTIEPLDTMICQGEILVLTTPTFEPGQFPDIDFIWSPTEGAQSPDSLLNFVVQPNETTEYERITTNGLCIDTTIATVEVVVPPDFTTTPTQAAICAGDSVEILITTGAEVSEPMWMPETGLSCTTCLDPIATPTSSTVYTFSAEFMGCPIGSSVSITVDQLPQVNIIDDAAICFGDAIQLNFNTDESATYNWSSPDDPDFSTNEPEPTISPIESGTYVVEVTNGCGTITDEVTVTVVPESALTVVPDDQTICSNETLVLNAEGSAPDGVEEVFEWNVGGQIFTGSEITLEELSTTTEVTITYTYGPGCEAEPATFTINVTDGPALNLAEDQELCAGESITLNDFSNDATSYSWTSSDGTFVSSEPEPEVIPEETVTYSVVASNGVCPDTEESVTITVVQEASLTVPESQSICVGDALTLSAEGSEQEGISETYTWIFNGQELNGSTIELEAGELSTTTDFEVQYTYGPDCATLIEFFTVTVNPEPTLGIIESQEICLGESIVLNEATDPLTTYAWTASDNSIVSDIGALEVSPTMTTTYTVVAATPNCPEVTEEVTITVVPDVDLTLPEDFTVCPGDILTIQPNVLPLDRDFEESFQWFADGTPIESATLNLELDALTATTEFTLEYTYGDDCGTIVESVTVEVGTLPNVDSIRVEPMSYLAEGVPLGDEVTLTAITSPEDLTGLSYVWSANGASIGGNTVTVTDVPTIDPTVYEVMVISEDGCTDTLSITLNVPEPQFRIPNIFSPNGDNSNDFFKVVHSGTIDVKEFLVYNRWGQVVFDEPSLEGWDGTHNGDPAPSDVYVYRIIFEFADGQSFDERGDVTLVR